MNYHIYFNGKYNNYLKYKLLTLQKANIHSIDTVLLEIKEEVTAICKVNYRWFFYHTA